MPFRELLGALVASVPGARGAIFCDYEGESVDLVVAAPQPPGCAPLSVYDLKICGAQLTAVWTVLQERSKANGAGRLEALRLAAEHGTLLCHAAKEGYYVTLLLAPRAQASKAAVAVARLARRFVEEM